MILDFKFQSEIKIEENLKIRILRDKIGIY